MGHYRAAVLLDFSRALDDHPAPNASDGSNENDKH